MVAVVASCTNVLVDTGDPVFALDSQMGLEKATLTL